jgi:hypothetical protein
VGIRFVGVLNAEKRIRRVSVIVTGNSAPGEYLFDYYFSITDGK